MKECTFGSSTFLHLASLVFLTKIRIDRQPRREKMTGSQRIHNTTLRPEFFFLSFKSMKSVPLKRNKAINTQKKLRSTLFDKTRPWAPQHRWVLHSDWFSKSSRRIGKSHPSVQKRTCAKSSAVLSAQRSSRVLERRRQHGARCRLTRSALRAVIRARWAATSTARQRGRHLPERRRRSSRRGNFAPKSLTQSPKDESLK